MGGEKHWTEILEEELPDIKDPFVGSGAPPATTP